MAQIKLTITADTQGVQKSVEQIKNQFTALSQQLSKLTVNKDLTAQIDSLSRYYETLATAASKTRNSATKTTAQVDTLRKSYANLALQIKTLKGQSAGGAFDGINKQVEANLKSVQALSEAYKNGNWGDKQAKELKTLSVGYKSLAADVAEVRLANEKAAVTEPFSPKLIDSLYRVQSRFETLKTTISGVEKYYPKGTFSGITSEINKNVASLKALEVEYQTTGKLSQQSVDKFNGISRAVLEQDAAFKQTRNSATNYHGSIKDIIVGFAKFQLSAMLVMKPLQMIRSALSSINETLVETENAVVSISRVLDENVSNGEISSEIYRIAQSLGQTFDVVQEIAQNFAKAGLDWQDSLKATEAAVLALNVAELTAEESSEGLIAIMQQFGYEAEALTYVIDVLNKTADKSAVNTQELLVALEKTGSYAKASNLTLEQTVALITAISEATAASGQNIGNALKSLFAYSSKDSALDVFAALSTDSAKVVEEYRRGAASILDVWRQLSEEINNLTADQGKKLDEYFASEEGSALEEALGGDLAEIQDSIKGVYDSAGVYRKNYFIALLGNMEEVDDVLNNLDDVAGYTMTEQEKYMETYTAKVNALKSQWQALVNDEQGILGFKKALVDIGSAVLTVIDTFGGLNTVLLLIGSTLSLIFGKKIAAWVTTLSANLDLLSAKFVALVQQVKMGDLSIRGLLTDLTKSANFWIIAVTAVLAVAQAITTAVRKAKEEAEELLKEQEEANQKAIENANDAIEANKSVVESITSYADSVKELRDVLSDSTSTDEEKQAAQQELLNIQKELIENNGSYKDSLDLVNGSIEEQLGLIEKLTDEQLAQQAQKWLEENRAAIEIAKANTTAQGSSSMTSTIGETGYGAGRDEAASAKIEEILKAAGVENATINFEHYNGFVAESVGAQVDEIVKGWEENGLLGAILGAFTGSVAGGWENITGVFSPEGWAGSSQGYISVSGTVEEQIAAWENIKAAIAADKELSAEQITLYTNEINKILASLNSAEYQEAERLMEVYDATEKLLNKEISREEYLEIVYGITSATEEEGSAVEDLTEKYDDLIKKLQELKDAQKDAWDWAESKQDVIDAQKELEEAEKALQEAQEAALQNDIDLTDEQNDLLEAQNALLKARQALERVKNERTVRRFSSTGNQWEWQTDEDKVTDAQEALLEAQDDLLEAQQDIVDAQNDAKEKLQEAIEDAQEDLENAQDRLAEAQYKLEQATYEKIIEDLEKGLATNESIEAILQEIKPLLGADSTLASDIANAIGEVFGEGGLPDGADDKGNGGDKDSGSGDKHSGTSDGNIIGGHRRPAGSVGGGLFAQSQLYDSGGVAKGRGLFAKGTDRHESIINDPDLTEKILSPVPSKQFDRYVRDMGILFEHARVYEQSPVMRSVVGNTDNSIDNSRQVIIKDVNVGAQKRDSLVDALGLAALVD